MKVLLVSRIDNNEAAAYTRKLAKVMEDTGWDTIFESDTANLIGRSGVSLAKAHVDLVLVVGGDGTILRTIHMMEKPVPVLGINWGEVGFLADLEPADALVYVSRLTDGFSVEERMRVSLFRDGTFTGNALNEALIVTTRPAKMLNFSIIVDSVIIREFRADGLLISTPTGSTAYAMSAGGPIVDPRVQGFLLVPLAPYMLSSRPHLISSDRHLTIRLESAKPANLVVDGQQTVELGTSASIEVRKSDKSALFVDVRRNFFEKVNKKLRKF